MTDLSVTVLSKVGQLLQNSPIRNSEIDVLVSCDHCGWSETIRFNARHVALLANVHFKRVGKSRLCKKRY